MHSVLSELGNIGIIPVIKIDDVDKAVPLARALIKGGIPCAEVTFRTAQGEEAMKRIHREVPEILLGAGTVLSPEQVDKAAAAGAAFIVSPGFNPRVVAHSIEKGLPVVPGCSTPSDVERALEAGLEVVKFFPAEQSGGLGYIKALAGPYPSVLFIPTGGINAQNVAAYTAFEKILACGGSWMVPGDLINAGNFEGISDLCREAVLSMLGFSFVHMAINAQNEEMALGSARLFQSLFGLKEKVGTASVFGGESIEIMKTPGPGKHGHIGIGSVHVPKAAAFLGRIGVAINEDSKRLDGKGRLNFFYLRDEIAGFAVHVVQKK
jgi:2-dehydro-3-deoxyphosphogluconate aldolase/(4S)-4-hydroxy-2-oxoglutarate aldolase